MKIKGHAGEEKSKNIERSKHKVGNGMVLYMIEDIFPIDKNNYLVPIWYI